MLASVIFAVNSSMIELMFVMIELMFVMIELMFVIILSIY